MWKQILPHPPHFPLILTRPSDLHEYLPSYFDVPQQEEIQTTIERLALRMRAAGSKVVVDLTHVIPAETTSGLKFDIFGMDNYCGSPFYMIHNQDEKWASFDLLLTDPVLQTDRLSMNWFCLAYKNAAPQQGFFMKNHLKEKTGSAPLAGSPSAAGSESYLTLSCRRFVDPAHPVLFSMWHWCQELFHEKTLAPQLELYRKQIFDHTRTLLNKLPSRLYDTNITYRIIPAEREVNPSFIDIRISGPLHQIRAAALVGGSLYLRCMEEGHPIFYRRSFGFYHPNFGLLFGKKSSTIRLTLGLDPTQIDTFVRCFETIDMLN